MSVGSLMYHLVMSRKSLSAMEKGSAQEEVPTFLDFLSGAPDNAGGDIIDNTAVVCAQLANEEMKTLGGDKYQQCQAIYSIAKSFFLPLFDSEGPGHFTTVDREREVNAIVEGRQLSSRHFSPAVTIVFSNLRRDTPLQSIKGALNAYSRLKQARVIESLSFIGVQREVAYWCGRVHFTIPGSGQKSVFMTPYLPTQGLVRAYVAACLSKFYTEELEQTTIKRVRAVFGERGISFDRPHLRATIAAANSILRTCVLDRVKLKLRDVRDPRIEYSIRSPSDHVALAFAFHFSGGSCLNPSYQLALERVNALKNLGLSSLTQYPLMPPDGPEIKLSDMLLQHMRVLEDTRRKRLVEGGRNLNHSVAYGIFSPNERITTQARNSLRLRERLFDVVNHVRARGVNPVNVFFLIEWNEAFDLSRVLTFMNVCNISGAIRRGETFIYVRPMSTYNKRMAIQFGEDKVEGAASDRFLIVTEYLSGLQFESVAFVAGGVSGFSEVGETNVLMTQAMVSRLVLADVRALLLDERVQACRIPLSYVSYDLVLPDSCPHILENPIGPDTPNFSCDDCKDRRSLLDSADSLFTYGMYFEKPRHTYGHNAHYAVVFDDLDGNVEARAQEGETYVLSRVAVGSASLMTCWRNLPGAELVTRGGQRFHADKEELSRELKEKIYALLVDEEDLGPVSEDQLPISTLTEPPDSGSSIET